MKTINRIRLGMNTTGNLVKKEMAQYAWRFSMSFACCKYFGKYSIYFVLVESSTYMYVQKKKKKKRKEKEKKRNTC